MYGPPHAAEEQLMQLQPYQWNKLMLVGPHGSSSYQQLKSPFNTNPNVKIELLVDQQAVRFSGTSDAVFSAHRHFTDALNKELHVDDR